MARLPRDPEQITREIDASIAVRDVKEWHRLREAFGFRWYEMFLLAGVFAFGLGVVVTIIFALPQNNEPLYYFMVLWCLGYVLMSILCLEFLIRRFRLLRRVIEIQQRRLEKLEKELRRQKRSAAAKEEG